MDDRIEPIFAARLPHATDDDRAKLRALMVLLALGGASGRRLMPDGCGLTIDARDWNLATCEGAALAARAAAMLDPELDAKLDGLADWHERLAEAFAQRLAHGAPDAAETAHVAAERARRGLH